LENSTLNIQRVHVCF